MLLISFVYGNAVMAPFNAILSTLDFFEIYMPGYAIDYIVSFAVNGVMVFAVVYCMRYSNSISNGLKINLVILITAFLIISLPFFTIKAS
jgi:hypothetical protein